MGTKYTTESITGYNSSPPSDDGSATEANKVKWSTIKAKLPDPLKTAIENIDTKLVNAADVGVDTYTTSAPSIGASDNGKLIALDTSSNNVNPSLAAAATLGDGWECTFILVDATNTSTITTNSTETINGVDDGHVLNQLYQVVTIKCNGSNFYVVSKDDKAQLTASGVLAPHKNLIVKRASGTTVDVDFDEVLLSDGSGNFLKVSSGDYTINSATTGAVNGTDTGSQAAGWWHVWLVSDGSTTGAVMSTSATWAGVAAGITGSYSYYAYLGAFYATSASAIRDFHQRNNEVITERVVAIDAGSSTSYTTISVDTALNTLVPDTAIAAVGDLWAFTSVSGDSSATSYLAADTTGLGEIQMQTTTNISAATEASHSATTNFRLLIKTAQTLYYKVDSTNSDCRVAISGWEY